MALVTSLPATTPFFVNDITYPILPVTWQIDVSVGNPAYRTVVPYFELFGGQSGWTSGSVGGTGVVDVFRAPLSQVGRSFLTSVVPVFQGHSGAVPWVTAAPADFAPGYENMEWTRVHIWDIRWVTDIGAGAPFNGETGFLFIPYHGVQFPGDLWPSGLAPLGGFGILGRAAAGLQAWQYNSFDSGTGATLDTVLIDPSVIPDVQEWTHAQFTHIASGPGREAVLSLVVNGVNIFTDKQFGSAELPRMQTLDPTAYLYAPTVRVGNPSSNQYTFSIRMRTGKFLLDGTEVRF